MYKYKLIDTTVIHKVKADKLINYDICSYVHTIKDISIHMYVTM